jgi:hypothetical protein
VDSAATTNADIAPIRKKTKRKMSSLQVFWEKINKDYPKLIDMIVDYDEKEVTIKSDGENLFESNDSHLSVIFSWPPVLPVSKSTTSFNSEEGAYYIKLILM